MQLGYRFVRNNMEYGKVVVAVWESGSVYRQNENVVTLVDNVGMW